jgi:hypothetical protein
VHPVDAFGSFLGGNFSVSGDADNAERMGDIRIGRQNGQGIATRAGLDKFGLDLVVMSPTLESNPNGKLPNLTPRFQVAGDKPANQIDKRGGSATNAGGNPDSIWSQFSQEYHGIPLWFYAVLSGITGWAAVYIPFFIVWFIFSKWRDWRENK